MYKNRNEDGRAVFKASRNRTQCAVEFPYCPDCAKWSNLDSLSGDTNESWRDYWTFRRSNEVNNDFTQYNSGDFFAHMLFTLRYELVMIS